MFYRRKIILAFIQIFGGELDKIRLQKLLFLFSQLEARPTHDLFNKLESNPTYDFIPYKFGCYSYSLNADLKALSEKNLIQETDKLFNMIDTTDYIKTLKIEDKKYLNEIYALYGKMSINTLIKHTYLNYPYFSINSEIAEELLTEPQLEKVRKIRNHFESATALFTIGYEGISLEAYLNRLIKNNISLLIDVRKNPLSKKYGFSKSLLKKVCESVGICYIHMPEVGINSDKRRELNTQLDYDSLFEDYKKTTIKETTLYQEKILNLLKQYHRVALTCFEANICQCHRKHLAEAVSKLNGFDYELRHI